MQIKTPVNLYFTLARMTGTKKSDNNKTIMEDVVKSVLLYPTDVNIKWYRCFEKQSIYQKIKHRVTKWPRNFIPMFEK